MTGSCIHCRRRLLEFRRPRPPHRRRRSQSASPSVGQVISTRAGNNPLCLGRGEPGLRGAVNRFLHVQVPSRSTGCVPTAAEFKLPQSEAVAIRNPSGFRWSRSPSDCRRLETSSDQLKPFIPSVSNLVFRNDNPTRTRPRSRRIQITTSGPNSGTLLHRHDVVDTKWPQKDRLRRLDRISPQQIQLTMLAFAGIRKTTDALAVLQTHPDRCGLVDPLQFLIHEAGESSPGPTPQGFDGIDFSGNIGPFMFSHEQVPTGC